MRITLIILILAFIALASCAKPKYIVKGLTLPPGSTVLNEMESKLTTLQIPMLGEVDKTITVNFDCDKDWNNIASHIDQAMQKEGYEESFSQLGNMMKGQNIPMQDEVMSSMRMWSKMGGKYQVMLVNNTALSSAGGVVGMDMGDYTLTVIQFKDD